MADTGPHWLKRWTFPLASGAGGTLEEDFQTEIGQKPLLLCTGWVGTADTGTTWGLGLTRLVASSGGRVPQWDVCLPGHQHLGCYDPVQQGTWVLDYFQLLTLRAAHGACE